MRYKFIDEVTILVRSGKGGAGCVSFRREKFIEFGGPNGGDGGRGANVVIKADGQRATLLDYKFKRRHIAPNGQSGSSNQKSGRSGEDIILLVPVGTIVFNADTHERLVDLNQNDSQVIVARGGRGGKGNTHFKSSTHQAPRFSQPGEPGEEFNLRLELKLLADVGVVGLPNVGKSSFIARVSAAKPKIADYPFTTLVPNLGVVSLDDFQQFVIADVPGLIVGAHTGAGLGSRFLRHVERVNVIMHMVSASEDGEAQDPIKNFESIENEMRSHNPKLNQVKKVMVLNKIDLPFVAEHKARCIDYAQKNNMAFFAISAVTGEGIKALINLLGLLTTQNHFVEESMEKDNAP